MKGIKRLLNHLWAKRICIRIGHQYHFDSYTLGGDWIRCNNCNRLEEYLPGLHEPKGYDYDAHLRRVTYENSISRH